MNLNEKAKKLFKVIIVNIFILIIIIGAIDLIFFDKKIPKNLSQYHLDLDIFTLEGNLNENLKYDFYKSPYNERGKKVYNIITDEEGFRIGPTRQLNNKEKNIIMVGDSFSFGAHAEFDSTIQGLLQKQYPHYNIWNLSVSGTSSYYYDNILSYYLEKKKIKPNILIVGLYVDMQVGDIPRVLARKKYGGMKAFDGILVSPSLYKSLQESFLRRLLFRTEVYLRRNTSLINILYPREQSPEFAIPLSENINDKDLLSLEEMLLENINDIQLASHLSPRYIIIWFVPSDHELTHKILKYPNKDEFYKLSRVFWDNCKMRFKEKGYSVIDPRDVIEDMALKENIFPYTVDGHLNEEGYKRIAGILMEEIDKIK